MVTWQGVNLCKKGRPFRALVSTALSSALVLGAIGCGAEDPGGPCIQREISALSYFSTPYRGVVRTATVGVSPSFGPEFEMDLTRGVSTGVGDQWTAASWIGAVLSVMTSGVNPAGIRMSVDVNGSIDGPSGGALMTAAMTSALLGDELIPGRSMTGTITPDGTIGSVAGIPLKLEAAARDGLTDIGIPLGQINSYNPATGERVDVVAEGVELGVDVTEMGVLDDAYELLTGRELRPTVDVTPATFGSAFTAELNTIAEERLAQAQSALTELQTQWGSQDWPDTSPVRDAERYAKEAAGALGKGRESLERGDAPTAYERARLATQLSLWGLSNLEAQSLLDSSGVRGLYHDVRSQHAAIRAELDQAIEYYPAEKPVSAAGLGASVGALFWISAAQARSELFNIRVEPLFASYTANGGSASELASALMVSRGFQVEAQLMISGYQDSLKLIPTLGGLPSVVTDPDSVSALASFFDEAGHAAFNYFERQTAVNRIGSRTGPLEEKLRELRNTDVTYGYALAARDALLEISPFSGNWRDVRLRLANASSFFVYSLYLIIQYDDVRANVKPAGWVGNAHRHEVLERVLANADKSNHVLRSQLVASNIDTSFAHFAADFGSARAHGAIKDYERMEGLSIMWFSNLMMQLTRQFGGLGTEPDFSVCQ